MKKDKSKEVPDESVEEGFPSTDWRLKFVVNTVELIKLEGHLNMMSKDDFAITTILGPTNQGTVTVVAQKYMESNEI